MNGICESNLGSLIVCELPIKSMSDDSFRVELKFKC